MNNLYNAVMGEIEAHDNQQVNGLFVTIDGFDFCASFEDDNGYQLLNSHEAEQLLALDNENDYDKLCYQIEQLAQEWNDILMTDYQAVMLQDKNYHAMNNINNYV